MQFPNLWLAGNADFLFTIYQSVGNGVSGGGGGSSAAYRLHL